MSEAVSSPLTEHSPPEELVSFYSRSYSPAGAAAEQYSRWRALGALGKADHVVMLCARAATRTDSTIEVGCGDGALLSELSRRQFGGALTGVEITESAVAIARKRTEIDEVLLYDGAHLPFADRAFDLAILSHVLEHVPRPHELLAEAARVSRATLLEVPLESNLSARRPSKRAHAAQVGHLHRLDRRAAREMICAAGLGVVAELEDPLPVSVHRFFASGVRARGAATAKWALRAGLHRVAPSFARQVFTVHYACLCIADPQAAPAARRAPTTQR